MQWFEDANVHFALSVDAGTLDVLTERLRNMGASPHGPVAHSGGDRSLYVEDPEGNVVEVWDFFVDGDGRRDGVAALADGFAEDTSPDIATVESEAS